MLEFQFEFQHCRTANETRAAEAEKHLPTKRLKQRESTTTRLFQFEMVLNHGVLSR